VATDEFKAVEAAQAAEIDAILRNDLEVLDRLWSDDLIMSSNENLIFTKEQVFGFFRNGLVKLETLERSISKHIVKGDVVFLIGNQQLMPRLGSATIGGPKAGELVMSAFMSGWVREGGMWKLIAWNQSPFGGTTSSE
jgi:hypothetical protein